MRRGIWFSLFVVLAVAGSVAIAIAAPGELPVRTSLRVVLWLGPSAQGLLERIQGQTNDLGIELVADEAEVIPGDVDDQWRSARKISQRYTASLVFWVVSQEEPANHAIVRLALPSAQRWLQRDLGTSGVSSEHPGLSSATLEGAAVVVRSAIQAVLAGAIVGEEGRGRFDDVPANTQNAPQSPVPSNGLQPPNVGSLGLWERGQQRSSDRWQSGGAPVNADGVHSGVGLHGLAVYDGVGDNSTAECAMARVDRSKLKYALFALGSACLGRGVQSQYGLIRVGRQEFAIGADLPVFRSTLTGSVGIHAGITTYERWTVDANANMGVQGHSSKLHVLGTTGPELRLRFPSGASKLTAEIAFGAAREHG